MHKRSLLLMVIAVFCLMGDSCEDNSPAAQSRREAEAKSSQRASFIPKNDVEFKNYDRRQQIADDPTAILWCTSAFPIPSSPLFTVPIVGKITSGGKRPYATEYRNGNATSYYPELPGPDGMYGSSGEYRYGFTPGGIYADWYGMPTFCTTEPMVWQRESTTIVMQTDPLFSEAHSRAREALKAGKPDEARRILEEAIAKAADAKIAAPPKNEAKEKK